MLAGRLRHNIEFQQESLAADGQGGSTRSWSSRAFAYASMKPLRAEERFYNCLLYTSTSPRDRG